MREGSGTRYGTASGLEIVRAVDRIAMGAHETAQ